MRKLFLLMMALVMAVGMAFSVSAETSPAIDVADFEDDYIGGVYPNGTSTLTASTDAYYYGTASLRVSGRDSEWGGPAWDVREYMSGKADGKFYCTFAVLGTFDGSIRATLGLRYSDGTSLYYQIGILTPFDTNEWKFIGVDDDGNTMPLRLEDWSIDYLQWDSVIKTANLESAILYFWIEGDNTSDVYLDNVNFWHESDTPIDYSEGNVNTTPKALDASFITTVPPVTLAPETTESEEITTNTPNTTDKPADSTAAPTSGDSNDSTWIIVAVAAAVVVVAVVVVVVVKNKKK